jgi:hypothetical protein
MFSVFLKVFATLTQKKKRFVIDAHGCVFVITSATELNTYEIYPRITLILLISKTLGKPPHKESEKIGCAEIKIDSLEFARHKTAY